jgi:hypothetical protein
MTRSPSETNKRAKVQADSGEGDDANLIPVQHEGEAGDRKSSQAMDAIKESSPDDTTPDDTTPDDTTPDDTTQRATGTQDVETGGTEEPNQTSQASSLGERDDGDEDAEEEETHEHHSHVLVDRPVMDQAVMHHPTATPQHDHQVPAPPTATAPVTTLTTQEPARLMQLPDEFVPILREVARTYFNDRTEEPQMRRVNEARTVLARLGDRMVWSSAGSRCFHFESPCSGCDKVEPCGNTRIQAWKAIQIERNLPCSRGLGTHRRGMNYV